MNRPRYREDFAVWSAEQAKALRNAGAVRVNTPDPIDWDDVAEEIESLGRSERRELRSRIGVVLEHLLKLIASNAQPPRSGWIETLLVQRREIDRILEDSPSLRQDLTRIIAEETAHARRLVGRLLALHDEQPLMDLSTLEFDAGQVLGDWLPERSAQGPPA